VTTFEEYQNQRYEGGSTHFGKWTLAAYQTLFDKMTQAWLLGKHDPLYAGLKPDRFTEDELSNYLFIG
jgi:neutral ceramidase